MMQKSFSEIYELNKKCMSEIKMFRKHFIDNKRFVNPKEEKWFTEILLNQECGIDDIDQYAKIMLKGYRKTK